MELPIRKFDFMLSQKHFYLFCFSMLAPILVCGQSMDYSNSVNVEYEHVVVKNENNWKFGEIWYGRELSNFTATFRLRYADRFSRNAYLSEADFYPVISDDLNAHLHVGSALTRKGLFPNFKAGGSLFYNLNPSLVGAVGIDYRSFEMDDILLYSSQLHLYAGEYLFIGQGLFQVRNSTMLGTGILTVRRYWSDGSYFYIKGAFGQSPQNLRFEEDVLNSFKSYLLSTGMTVEFSRRFVLRSALNYRESIFSNTGERTRFGISLGFGYHF